MAGVLGRGAAVLCCPKKPLELSSNFLESSLSYSATHGGKLGSASAAKRRLSGGSAWVRKACAAASGHAHAAQLGRSQGRHGREAKESTERARQRSLREAAALRLAPGCCSWKQRQREKEWAEQKEKWALERAKDEAERQQLLDSMRDLEVPHAHITHIDRQLLIFSFTIFVEIYYFAVRLLVTRQ